MIGVGEIDTPEGRKPPQQALSSAGLAPLALGPKEGLALLNGTQFSTAYALAAMFACRQSAAHRADHGRTLDRGGQGFRRAFRCRIHALRRHRGQIDCADALRRLMAGSAIRASHLVGDDRVQDPYCLRCQPQVMGAVLDTLRHVASVLGDEANGVSDNPLIFAEEGDRALGRQLSCRAGGAGRRHDGAGDLRDRLAGRAAHCHAGRSCAVAFARVPDAQAGLNSGFMIPQVTAAALTSENKQRAAPASIDSIPTSANQEDHVSMAAHAARRLLSMAENLTQIIGIELLAGCQGCDFHAPARFQRAVERVRALLRAQFHISTRTAILLPTSPPPPTSCARARWLRRRVSRCRRCGDEGIVIPEFRSKRNIRDPGHWGARRL